MPEPGLTPNLKRAGVDDVGGGAFDEINHVVKGCSEVVLVTVFFNVANVWRADAVLKAQQCMALQNRLRFKHVNGRHAWGATVERTE